MFDAVCLRGTDPLSTNPREPLDLGFLAECLLFYGKVNLVADRNIVEQLASSMDHGALFNLMRDGFLDVSYLPGGYGLRAENAGTPHEMYVPAVFEMSTMALDVVAPRAFGESTRSSGRARREARAFQSLVTPIRLGGQDVYQAALDDYHDPGYLSDATRETLRLLAPGYPIPEPLVYEVDDAGDFVRLTTNIDFDEVNRYSQVPTGSIHPNFVLAHLTQVRGQLHVASSVGGELATDGLTSACIRLKFDDLLDASAGSRTKVTHFQERLLGNGHAIAEAINSGEKDFADLLEILHLGTEFRRWVRAADSEADLLEQYYADVAKRSWISTLPAKTLRWSMLTALGVIAPPAGTIAAAGIGALDMFLLDRLAGGWKPNHFVEKSLARFVP